MHHAQISATFEDRRARSCCLLPSLSVMPYFIVQPQTPPFLDPRPGRSSSWATTPSAARVRPRAPAPLDFLRDIDGRRRDGRSKFRRGGHQHRPSEGLVGIAARHRSPRSRRRDRGRPPAAPSRDPCRRGRKTTKSECFHLKPGPFVLDPTAVKDQGGGWQMREHLRLCRHGRRRGAGGRGHAPGTLRDKASPARRALRPGQPSTSRSRILPRRPEQSAGFLQLLGVRRHHRAPPRLAWRRKQRRPRAARSPRSFSAAPSPGSRARRQPRQMPMPIIPNPDRPWPIVRTPGTQGVDGK